MPIPEDTPRSPQRLWIEASLRRYFDGGRDPNRLLADYLDRTARAKRRETAASEIANGRRMLERFAELDRSQPDPTRVLLKPISVPVCGHGVTMGIDVAYQTLEGWVLRQVLTDDEIRRTEHVRLYAAATALHSRDIQTAAMYPALRSGCFASREASLVGPGRCLVG